MAVCAITTAPFPPGGPSTFPSPTRALLTTLVSCLLCFRVGVGGTEIEYGLQPEDAVFLPSRLRGGFLRIPGEAGTPWGFPRSPILALKPAEGLLKI